MAQNTPTLIPRIYGGFRGVDFRGADVNLSRSPDSLNMWRDYRETDSIRTRPGLEKLRTLDGAIYGIFFFEGRMIIHSGTKVYIESGNSLMEIYGSANEKKSVGFVFKERFYFLDGKNYLSYSSDGPVMAPVVGYIPTTTIAKAPDGGGETYEDVNFLSEYRINSFLSDGKSTDYELDTENIDDDYVPIVTVYGETVTDFTVDYENGIITFPEVIDDASPWTDGQDNVTIKFKKTVNGYYNVISECTMIQIFDNRVFFSGNPKYPNTIYHCSLNDPSYCSDQDYYEEGMDDAPVRGMVAGNDALWVFREPSDSNTTVFYHRPMPIDQYGTVYPSSHSSITTGCIGGAINFNDDIVFFSDRGMEGISGDITTEQAVSHRSTVIDKRILAEKNYRNMLLDEWDGYLLTFIENRVYLADSRSVFRNDSHTEYDFFYWEFDESVTCSKVKDGILYLGMGNAVYSLTDRNANVRSYWETPKDKFENPNKLKTTNKRGCIAEATGDISVYAKTEDTEYDLIGEYVGVTDSFVSRIKKKKFKDIQLKFSSETRFSLEMVTLEAFVGGYIKR